MRPQPPFLTLCALLVLAAGCGGSGGEAPAGGDPARLPLVPPGSQALGPSASASPAPAGIFQGRVVQTIDAGPYTYVEVDSGQGSAWAAAPQFSIDDGTLVRFSTRMPMSNYHSETLDRTFEVVYFTDSVAPVDGAAAAAGSGELPPGHPPLPTQPAGGDGPGSTAAQAPAGLDLTGIEVPEDGLSIAEVHARRAELDGERVVVRGRVVKFTPGVMGHNWLHVRDGSGEGDSADLTIVTDDDAQVGDLVTATGLVAIDQDFGFNYQYAVLVQDATIRAD